MKTETAIISELRAALRRRGVWGKRAERLIQEWTVHVRDDVAQRVKNGAAPDEARGAAWRALGQPQVLAVTAGRELAQASWLGRYPWLGGLVLPVLVWLVTWNAVLYAPGVIFSLCGNPYRPPVNPLVAHAAVVCWQQAFNWIPWLLSTAWLARIAVRMPGGWKLFWVTLVAVTLCSTSTWVTIYLTGDGAGWSHADISPAGIFGTIVSALPSPSGDTSSLLAPSMAQTLAWIQTAILMLGALTLYSKATASAAV